MSYYRIKKVITKKGQVMYYLGDGIWFGRISKDQAESGLESTKYVLWETVDKSKAPRAAYKTVLLDCLMHLSNTVH